MGLAQKHREQTQATVLGVIQQLPNKRAREGFGSPGQTAYFLLFYCPPETAFLTA